MRKTSIAAASLVTGLVAFYAAAAGSAAAEPANNGNASAYGVSASGLAAIPPTITASASQPPDTDAPFTALLDLPVGSFLLNATVGVAANAHQADDITPVLATVPDAPGTSKPIALGPSNIRARATTEALAVAYSGVVGDTLLGDLDGLVTADVITSEAVAKCVDGQPVFDAGFQIIGLGGLVGDIDPTLEDLVRSLLELVGFDGPLSDLIAVEAGMVTRTPTSIAIDGLTVRSALLNQTITISHSEVHMAADCTVVAPPTTAPPAGPGGGGGGGGRLAATGTGTPYLPTGVGMVALALIGGGIVGRSRKATIQ